MFAKETYIHRREGLKKTVGSGIILLLGNDESPMNYKDNTFHFRQDSSFLYFFGLKLPGMVGFMDCDSGEMSLFGKDLTIEDFVWTGVQPPIKSLASQVGISSTGSLKEFDSIIKKHVDANRNIHFLPPYRPENNIKLFKWLGIVPEAQLGAASADLIKSVVDQRNYKTAEEISEITKAVNTSVDMHTLAMRMAKPGVSEAKIAAAVQEVAVGAGGQISFPVIATVDGQILHTHYHGNTLKNGDMFLLDAGAETAMGYCGDLSSTIPVSGKFNETQKEIYSICLESHNRSIELLKPGISFKEIYFESCRIIVQGLKDLGIMKGNVEDALINGAHALFFPCGVGHMMGLDVHDMEDLGEVYVGYDGQPKSTQFGLKSLRLGRKLEPGFVLTIEPGIYFIPELIHQWQSANTNGEFINYKALEAYKSFGGLRNEENFLITDSGYQLIGKQKPKSIEAVETAWAEGI